MFRFAAAAALSAIVLVAPAPASAQGRPPDAAHLRQAAEHFDAGVAAYKRKDFDGAASEFEAADAAAPSPTALRQAIRARDEESQGSRAATLAAQALERYPDDEPTAKLARETLEKLEPLLHKVVVSCASPCLLATDWRSIPGEATTRWIVYLDPGDQKLGASFFGGGSSTPKDIKATAGGSSAMRFDPDDKKLLAAPVPTPTPTPDAPSAVPPFAAPPIEDPAPRSGISPVFFAVAAVATNVLIGVTIWSGVDAKTNPGPDAVKAACAGKGVTCPLYQEGLAKQTRTNVLIGVTAGTAAAGVVLAIFTRWRSEPKKPAAALAPFLATVDRGALAGAGGVF